MLVKSGHVAAGPRQRLDQAVVHRIGEPHEHGRYGAGLIAQGQRSRAAARDDHVGRELDELLGRCLRLCALPPSPADVETDIVLPAQLLQRLGEGGDVQLRLRIGRGAAEQKADPTRAMVRLRAGCERPIDRRRRRAAEKGNEFAPPHSVTTSPPGRPFRPAGICSCSCRTRGQIFLFQPRQSHSSPILRASSAAALDFRFHHKGLSVIACVNESVLPNTGLCRGFRAQSLGRI